MLFNSQIFFIFLIFVFIFYWLVLSRFSLFSKNLFLLLSSLVFYGWWDWRFLFLLCANTAFDYFIALRISKTTSDIKRKNLLYLSISINLLFLCFFKYFNFFIESWVELFNFFGFNIRFESLHIILPVGISFYTFHGLSYLIDVYKKRIEPSNSYVDYSLFVSYFPLLVAGPIERATHLLPQIAIDRNFSFRQSINGLILIFWGLFKKVVIADNLAVFVDDIFLNYNNYNSTTLIIAAISFSFQIYSDFSGYSDIARGTSKLFGIELLLNFNFPYFSKNISEFWNKWHISLSQWFRDYIYIPLGGSRTSKFKAIRNVFIIFLISGFWHGANWTFIFWGFYHAVLFLPLYIYKHSNFTNLISKQYSKFNLIVYDILHIIKTFLFVTIGWIFFRSVSLGDSFLYIKKIFLWDNCNHAYAFDTKIYILTLFMLFIEYLYSINFHTKLNFKFIDIFFILVLIVLIILFGYYGDDISFIYFQF
jgi:alginate O-acetyltransferase complex protein AlgI